MQTFLFCTLQKKYKIPEWRVQKKGCCFLQSLLYQTIIYDAIMNFLECFSVGWIAKVASFVEGIVFSKENTYTESPVA
jgi:hypothetical protein